jgi:hypothetical protein
LFLFLFEETNTIVRMPKKGIQTMYPQSNVTIVPKDFKVKVDLLHISNKTKGVLKSIPVLLLFTEVLMMSVELQINIYPVRHLHLILTNGRQNKIILLSKDKR